MYIALERCRNGRVGDALRQLRTTSLVGEKEKELSPVLIEVAREKYGSANRHANGAKAEYRFRQTVPIVEEIVGVELLMALISVHTAVKLAGSGFRDEADRRTWMAPVLGA